MFRLAERSELKFTTQFSLAFGFICILAIVSTETRYNWKESEDWLPCSVTCGKGIKIKEIFCAMTLTNGTFVKGSKHNCRDIAEPKVNIMICHLTKCPTNHEWKVNPWSSCSQSCGHLGFKTRDVDCLDMNDDSSDAIVEEYLCGNLTKPLTRSICNRVDCKASFVPGKWGPCSITQKCEPGKQVRRIKCQKVLKSGRSIPVPIAQCYRRGLTLPQEWRHCSYYQPNEHCNKLIPQRKVKFTVLNNNLYQMRRSKLVNLQIGQVGYLLPFSRVLVECPIDDFPLEEIRWTHQNKTFKYEAKVKRRTRVDKNGKLRIKMLLFEDQGEWKCKADESFKSVIIKIRSPSSGYRDWAIRSNLWKAGMLSEESIGSRTNEEVVHWVKSEWSVCSVTCSGDGSQYREVQCERVKHKTYEILEDIQCERALKSLPARIRTCHNSVKCPTWYFNHSNQYKCLPKCVGIGLGMWDIDLKCIYLQREVPQHLCDWTKKPKLHCQNDVCQLDWRLSSWSKCSQTCGAVGHQARYITCVWKYSRKSAKSLCHDTRLPIPVVVRKCTTKPCRMGCVDLSTMCSGNSRTCYHGLYRHLCCLTCSKYFQRLT